jgi:outer membrane protein assembly factor BamB
MAVADGVVYATTSLGEIFAFDAKNGNVLWRLADPAITFVSGLLISDGVVYVSSGYDKRDNAGPVLYALQARTGHQLWQHPLGASLYSAGFDVYQGVVFACVVHNATSPKLGAGDLLALNAATGQPLWNFPVAGAINTITAGPGNVIYTGNTQGTLDVWHANTGNHLWSHRAAGTISHIGVRGGVVYFGSTDHRVYAVAAQPS